MASLCRRLFLVSAILFGFLAFFANGQTPVVADVIPRSGSLQGGTYVTIIGSGFKVGPFGTTTLNFGVVPCVVQTVASSDSTIVCITSAVPTAMIVDGTYSPAISGFVTSGGRNTRILFAGSNQFWFSSSQTPVLYWLEQASGYSRPLSFSGLVRGRTSSQYTVLVGNQWCSLDVDPMYDPRINIEPYGDWMGRATLFCQLPNLPAGRYDISVSVQDSPNGLGLAQKPIRSKTATPSGAVSDLTVYPIITGISSATGGNQGGNIITIRGWGFDANSANNAVVLSGSRCSIISSTASQIVCRAGPAYVGAAPNTTAPSSVSATSVSWGGSRGIFYSAFLNAQWWSSTVFGDSRIPNVPSFSGVNTISMTGISTSARGWISIHTAYFVPPVTSFYRFYVSALTYGEVRLSSDSTTANLLTIASTAGANPICSGIRKHYCNGMQISEAIRLEAGRKYLFQTRYICGNNDPSLSVAMRIVNPPNPNPVTQRWSSVSSIQEVRILSDNIRAIQRIRISGVVSGSFRLIFGPSLSNQIPWDATADTFKQAILLSNPCLSAIDVFRSVDNTTVPGTIIGYTWDITFNCFTTGSNNPFFVFSSISFTPSQGTVVNWDVTPLIVGSSPVSGNFRLGYGQFWTQPIPSTAAATTVQTALLALPGLADVEVEDSGDARFGKSYLIRFREPWGPVPAINIDSSALIGTNVRMVVVEIQSGSTDIFYDPIPADYFELVVPYRPVEIAVNGIKAVCDPSVSLPANPTLFYNAMKPFCSYTYETAPTVFIDSIFPIQIGRGTVVTIVGRGFIGTIADYTAYFIAAGSDRYSTAAGPACTITSLSTTGLLCTVGDMPSTIYNIQVVHRTKGFPSVQATATSLYYQPASITANNTYGSYSGGGLLTIRGSGLLSSAGANGTVVTVDNVACPINTISDSLLTCFVPAYTGTLTNVNITVAIRVTISGAIPFSTTLSQQYTYREDLSPAVVIVGPTSVSASDSATITIYGTKFTSALATMAVDLPVILTEMSNSSITPYSNLITVDFGGRPCELLYVQNDRIECRLYRAAPPALSARDVAPNVNFKYLGNANTLSSAKLRIDLHVTSVTPNALSFGGGADLTINGAGFIPTTVSNANSFSRVAAKQTSVVLQVAVPANTFSAQNPPATTPSSLPAGYKYIPINVICDVQSESNTQIICTTRPIGVSIYTDPKVLVAGVVVTVNSISTTCPAWTETCSTTFSSINTPVILGLSPASGPSGTDLTISGTAFDRFPIQSVNLGDGTCTVLDTVSSFLFRCRVASGTAGRVPVLIKFQTVGYALFQSFYSTSVRQAAFTITPRVSDISPATGSFAGGTMITLSGTGFNTAPEKNIIRFDRFVAVPVSASSSRLVVQFPATNLVASTNQLPVPHSLSASIGVWAYSTTGNENPFAIDDTDVYNATATVDAQQTCASGCIYTRVAAGLPFVTGIRPTSGFNGNTITITGSGFADTDRSSLVQNITVGAGLCRNINVTNTTFLTCVLNNAFIGTYPVYVYIGGGLADRRPLTASVFNVLGQVTGVSPPTGSIAGGQVITVTGTGFGNIVRQVSVSLSGANCTVLSVNHTFITCTTSQLLTVTSLFAYRHIQPTVIKGVPFFTGTPLFPVANAFDDDEGTYFQTSQAHTVSIGQNYGPSSRIWLTKIRYFPYYSVRNNYMWSFFEGTRDNTNWVTLSVLTGPFFDGWNEIAVDESVNAGVGFLSIRLRCQTFTWALMNEMQFVGYRVGNDPNGVVVPTVTIASTYDQIQQGADNSTTISNSSVRFNYTAQATPIVTRISPNNGTSLGGTVVTLTGSNFGTATSAVVLLNGSPCNVTSVTSTSIVCTTAPRCGIEPSSLVVVLPGAGAAVSNSTVRFRYIDRWSQLTSWYNFQPPMDGDSVLIPRGQSILMDISPPKLFLLQVSGELIFDRRDLSLTASYIVVQGGLIEVGTEEQPFTNNATITLNGDPVTSIEIPFIGAKVIGVIDTNFAAANTVTPPNSCLSMADPFVAAAYYQAAFQRASESGIGRLDMHGKPRPKAWTKLNATALAGDTTITVSENINIAPGDTIVVSGHNFTSMYDEVMVSAVNGNQLTLAAPLQYNHESFIYDTQAGVVDMRVLVGVRSSNIVVQGDRFSASTGFGVRVIFAFGGMARIENTLFRQCGQAGRIGFSCVDFFTMENKGTGSYIRSSIIHDGNNRAISVRSSNNVQVKGNFAFRVYGYHYAVESGKETGNVFDQNAGYISDLDPRSVTAWALQSSIFLISAAYNIWTGNVAAGSSYSGFTLAFPARTTGLAGIPNWVRSTPEQCPQGGRLGGFVDNTAYGNGHVGVVFPWTYNPRDQPCNTDSPVAPTFIQGLTLFRNRNVGLRTRILGAVYFNNIRAADNGNMEVALDRFTVNNMTDIPLISDSILVGTVNPPLTSPKLGLGLPGDEHVYMSNVRFVNYFNQTSVQGCLRCNDPNLGYSQGGFTYRSDRLTFANCSRRVGFGAPNKDIYWDLDGSLTGRTNSMLAPDYRYNRFNDCTVMNVTLGSGLLCANGTRIRAVRVSNVAPWMLEWRNLIVTTAVGVDLVPFRWGHFWGWNMLIITGRDYNITWQGAQTDLQSAFMFYSNTQIVSRDESLMVPLGQNRSLVTADYVRMRFPFREFRFQYNVDYLHRSFRSRRPYLWPPVDPDPTRPFGTSSVINNTMAMTLGAVNVSYTDYDFGLSVFASAISCPASGCPVPTPNVQVSENFTISPSGCSTVNNDNDLTIAAGCTIQLTYSPQPFRQCLIYGTLFFSDATDITFTCSSIVVWGTMIGGNVTTPRTRKLDIVLTGDIRSVSPSIDSSLFVGNKVLAVFGRMELRGARVATTWTKLAATANAGASVITVNADVTWLVGDFIAIGSTEYVDQSENATITAISGRTITLSRSLSFTHYAGNVTLEDGRQVFLAAPVAVLNRNIVIRSNITGEPYGPHIYVGEILRLPTAVTRGSMVMEYVQCSGCGKANSDQPALTARYFPLANIPAILAATLPTGNITILGCSWTDSKHFAINIDGASFTNINDTVIYNALGGGIYTTDMSNGGIIHNNLVISARQTNATLSIPSSGMNIEHLPDRFSNNLVNGAFENAFSLYSELCVATASVRNANNEAQASSIGFWLLSRADNNWGCSVFARATAWKVSHIAFFSADSNTIINLRNITIADSHIGVSINYFRDSTAGNTMEIADSIIMGSTPASSCAASVDCRVVVNNQLRSGCVSIGRQFRRIGIMTPNFHDRTMTCGRSTRRLTAACRRSYASVTQCAPTYGQRAGLTRTTGAEMQIRRVTFSNWAASDCGNFTNAAIAWNPTQTDYTPMVSLSGINWQSTVDANARFFLGTQSTSPALCSSSTGCDGRLALLFTDVDGTTFGARGGTLIANSGTALSTCSFQNAWKGFVCVGTFYRQMIYEDLSSDKQRLFNVKYARLTGEVSTVASAGSDVDGCGFIRTNGIVPFLTLPNNYHALNTSTPPNQVRLTYLTTNASEVFMAQIFYPQPWQVDVYVQGRLVAANNASAPSISSPVGSNILDPQNRVLFVKMAGLAGTWSQFEFRIAPVIMITMRLSVTIEQFFGPQLVSNLGALLQIPADRLKVASVSAGSAIVKLVIPPSPSVRIDDYDPTNTTDCNFNVARTEDVVLTGCNETLADECSNPNTTFAGFCTVLAQACLNTNNTGSPICNRMNSFCSISTVTKSNSTTTTFDNSSALNDTDSTINPLTDLNTTPLVVTNTTNQNVTSNVTSSLWCRVYRQEADSSSTNNETVVSAPNTFNASVDGNATSNIFGNDTGLNDTTVALNIPLHMLSHSAPEMRELEQALRPRPPAGLYSQIEHTYDHARQMYKHVEAPQHIAAASQHHHSLFGASGYRASAESLSASHLASLVPSHVTKPNNQRMETYVESTPEGLKIRYVTLADTDNSTTTNSSDATRVDLSELVSYRKFDETVKLAPKVFSKLTSSNVSNALQYNVEHVNVTVITAGLSTGDFLSFLGTPVGSSINSLYGDNPIAPGSYGFYLVLFGGAALLAVLSLVVWNCYCKAGSKKVVKTDSLANSVSVYPNDSPRKSNAPGSIIPQRRARPESTDFANPDTMMVNPEAEVFIHNGPVVPYPGSTSPGPVIRQQTHHVRTSTGQQGSEFTLEPSRHINFDEEAAQASGAEDNGSVEMGAYAGLGRSTLNKRSSRSMLENPLPPLRPENTSNTRRASLGRPLSIVTDEPPRSSSRSGYSSVPGNSSDDSDVRQ